jgi:hypothetical protein
MPMRRSPASRSTPASMSAWTPVTIDPTVRQATRISSVTADLEHAVLPSSPSTTRACLSGQALRTPAWSNSCGHVTRGVKGCAVLPAAPEDACPARPPVLPTALWGWCLVVDRRNSLRTRLHVGLRHKHVNELSQQVTEVGRVLDAPPTGTYRSPPLA